MGSDSASAPEVTTDGAEYWISWQGTRGGVLKQLATRVTLAGAVEAGAEIALKDLPAGSPSERGGIAAVGSGLVLAAQTSDTFSSGGSKGWMRRVTAGQVPSVSRAGPAAVPGRCQRPVHGRVGRRHHLRGLVGVHGCPRPVPGDPRASRADLGMESRSIPLRCGSAAVPSAASPVAFDGSQFLVDLDDQPARRRRRPGRGPRMERCSTTTPINLDRSPFAGRRRGREQEYACVTFGWDELLVVERRPAATARSVQRHHGRPVRPDRHGRRAHRLRGGSLRCQYRLRVGVSSAGELHGWHRPGDLGAGERAQGGAPRRRDRADPGHHAITPRRDDGDGRRSARPGRGCPARASSWWPGATGIEGVSSRRLRASDGREMDLTAPSSAGSGGGATAAFDGTTTVGWSRQWVRRRSW